MDLSSTILAFMITQTYLKKESYSSNTVLAVFMDPEGTVLQSLEGKYWIEIKLCDQLKYWVRGQK